MLDHNLKQNIIGLEKGKQLLKKHFIEETSNHNKRGQDDPDKDITKEHSKSHSDMIDEEVLTCVTFSVLFLSLIWNTHFIMSVFGVNVYFL